MKTKQVNDDKILFLEVDGTKTWIIYPEGELLIVVMQNGYLSRIPNIEKIWLKHV